jgi:hypothetical protein
MDTKHLTHEAMESNSRPSHFTDVLRSGNIIAADDSVNMMVTWRKGSKDFNLWSYKSGQFVRVGVFGSEKKPDRTRTAVSLAKRQIKLVKKDLGL